MYKEKVGSGLNSWAFGDGYIIGPSQSLSRSSLRRAARKKRSLFLHVFMGMADGSVSTPCARRNFCRSSGLRTSSVSDSEAAGFMRGRGCFLRGAGELDLPHR
jgi:hypothetical protein